MKILFSGGGTGGHFYPIIAIVQALNEKAREKRILSPKYYYMAPSKYNPRALFDNEIEYIHVPAGKIRRYFSILNVTDFFKTIWGVIVAIVKVYNLYPDVVFGKGGYASFPVLFAARLLKIPVVIHESDSSPGRVNAWAAKFAEKIAVSYPEATNYFEEQNRAGRVAVTGNPIRQEIMVARSTGSRDFLKLEENIPVVFILGGSQGSQILNDTIIDSLSELTNRYQIIHQTGKSNYEIVKNTAAIVLRDNRYAHRYHPYDYMDDLTLRVSAGAASIIVSRAGSQIFEIAAWGVPAILVPLSKEVSHDQTKNAFAYARAGGATVIEEHNLTSHILISEIDRIVNNQSIVEGMKESAQEFSRLDAAQKIALVLLEIGLRHE